MSRVIITTDDEVPMDTALEAVGLVIKKGRISAEGKAYCYATLFNVTDVGRVVVYAEKRKASDSFRVYLDAPA